MCGKQTVAVNYYDCVYNKVCMFLDLLQQSVLIEGVLFRARYLGSTQLVCEGQPTKTTRMMQAEEAVSRIKVTHAFIHLLIAPLHSCTYECCIVRNSHFDGSCFSF